MGTRLTLSFSGNTVYNHTETFYQQLHGGFTGAPLFVRFANIDQIWFEGVNGNIRQEPMLDANIHLTTGSPCINRADPSVAPLIDFDGDRRPQGSGPDIGADEFVE